MGSGLGNVVAHLGFGQQRRKGLGWGGIGEQTVDLRQRGHLDHGRAVELADVGRQPDLAGMRDDGLRYLHFTVVIVTQRAIGLIRHHAAEWGIKPDRVGILGFSAGGHLTVTTALHANERTYTTDPKLDVEDATPNFAIPVYPAYLVSKEEPTKLLPGFEVGAKAPPMCFVHAHDDPWPASGSALLYLEYKKKNLPAELHIYAKGGHGFGMKKSGQPVNEWPVRVVEWMKSMGYLD